MVSGIFPLLVGRSQPNRRLQRRDQARSGRLDLAQDGRYSNRYLGIPEANSKQEASDHEAHQTSCAGHSKFKPAKAHCTGLLRRFGEYDDCLRTTRTDVLHDGAGLWLYGCDLGALGQIHR